MLKAMGQGPIGHRPQGPSPQAWRALEYGEGDAAQAEEQGLAVGEQTHQGIGGQAHQDQIRQAPSAVMAGDPAGGAGCSPGAFHQIEQGRHITPAEIQPLAADGMAAVARFPHQQPMPLMQPGGQAQLEGHGAGLIQQGFDLKTGRKHTRQSIEQARAR